MDADGATLACSALFNSCRYKLLEQRPCGQKTFSFTNSTLSPKLRLLFITTLLILFPHL